MRQLGTPGVQESLSKSMEIAKIAKDIMETLKSPEFVKNIENFRLISDNMREASNSTEKSVKNLIDTGIINEAKDLITSTKNMLGKEGNAHTLWEMSSSLQEMFQSVRGLFDELRVTVAYSKDSGSITNLKEIVHKI